MILEFREPAPGSMVVSWINDFNIDADCNSRNPDVWNLDKLNAIDDFPIIQS